ncbi:rCG22416 [Rattus norvegicus]|uniref:RCG22416 n=1 Tax=Rattus norvegicus TaxID=10116 RepID=A6IN84_RAT|nr:rCG22416 [Rattus norvegicus]
MKVSPSACFRHSSCSRAARASSIFKGISEGSG